MVKIGLSNGTSHKVPAWVFGKLISLKLADGHFSNQYYIGVRNHKWWKKIANYVPHCKQFSKTMFQNNIHVYCFIMETTFFNFQEETVFCWLFLNYADFAHKIATYNHMAQLPVISIMFGKKWGSRAGCNTLFQCLRFFHDCSPNASIANIFNSWARSWGGHSPPQTPARPRWLAISHMMWDIRDAWYIFLYWHSGLEPTTRPHCQKFANQSAI